MAKQPFKNKEVLRAVGVLAAGLLSAWPFAANAASLYLEPASGVYAAETDFSVSVGVDTGGAEINAVEAALEFNPDELRVVRISKENSIFGLWTEEPRFSNETGRISFAGITTKFFSGKGEVIRATFKAARTGEIPVRFSSGAVLAADGKASNLLSVLEAGIYTITPKTIFPPAEYVVPAGAPAEPDVKSPTHPDPEKWYSGGNVKFAWPVPADITAIRLFLDKEPYSVPAEIAPKGLVEKNYPGLSDGVWFFHIQFQNQNGWGKIAHFRARIDAKKPEKLNIVLQPPAEPAEFNVRFFIEAADSGSGIDYYEIRINDGEKTVWQPPENGIFAAPALPAGNYVLKVKAVDKAGNFLAGSAGFSVGSLTPPQFTDWKPNMRTGDILVARGQTYPLSEVTVWMEKNGQPFQVQTVKSEDKGMFVFIAEEKLEKGLYEFWAEVESEKGVKSEPSEKIAVTARTNPFIEIGTKAISILAVLIPLILMTFALLFSAWWGWHKFAGFRKKIRKEVYEAEQALRRSFAVLHRDIRQYLTFLEKSAQKRKPTEEENRLLKKISQDLDESEYLIGKEIEDIEKIG